MKPEPRHRTKTPEYPSGSGLKLARRDFLRLISAAGLAASAMPMFADGEATKKTGQKTLKQMVKDLAAQLGDDEFRKRRAATKSLILIGKGSGGKTAKDREAKVVVVATLTPLLKHQDPEVSARAKQVIRALYPPKPPKSPRGREDIQLGGLVIEKE